MELGELEEDARELEAALDEEDALVGAALELGASEELEELVGEDEELEELEELDEVECFKCSGVPRGLPSDP